MTRAGADVSAWFGLLGPVAAVVDGTRVSLGGPKQRCVLSLLLLEPGRVVSRERIVDAVWGDDPPDGAANALQAAVSRLRRVLRGHMGTSLVAHGSGYLVEVDPAQVDLHRFRELTVRARQCVQDGDDAGAAPLFDRAIALWRGQPLAGIDSDLMQQRVVPGLERERISALVDSHDLALRMDQGARLVPQLTQLVEEHPFEERLRVQLMLALQGRGQLAAALDVYRRWRALLADEHSLEPSEDIQRLQQSMLRGSPAAALVQRYAAAAQFRAAPGTTGEASTTATVRAQRPPARLAFGLFGLVEVECLTAPALAVLLDVPTADADTVLRDLAAANLLTISPTDRRLYRLPGSLRPAAVDCARTQLDHADLTTVLRRTVRYVLTTQSPANAVDTS